MKKSLFVGCLVFLLAGCSGQKPSATAAKTDGSSNSTQLAQTKQSANTPSAAQSNVQLISQGAEPRQKLRFTPPANAKQTVQMTMKMNMAMSVAGQTQPTFNSPPIKMTMQTEVTKVDDNGDIHANFSYTDADIVAQGGDMPPQALEAMRAQLKKLVGLRGSMVVDNQGNTKDVNLDLPEELEPNSKQMVQQTVNSLKQISSPVPTEPVGVGATWKVPNKVTLNGMTLNQVATYELVGLKDNVATLQVSMEQQAEGQKLNPPGLPPGASIDLKSMNSQGQGKIEMAMNKIMPIDSNISMTSNMEMMVKDPNNQQQTTMGMKSTTEISLESN
jgi:hypothetical protein